MSKFLSKFILLIIAINFLFTNSQEIDGIELEMEDHLKGKVDEEEIRKGMKITTIREENSKQETETGTPVSQINSNQNSTETNQTIDFGKSNTENSELKTEEVKEKKENIFEEIKGAYRIRSRQELQFLFEIEDLVFLKFSYKSSSKISNSVAKYIKSISEKLEYLVGFILIDCDSYEPNWQDDCSIENTDSDPFPKLKLYVPPEKRFEQQLNSWQSHFEIPWTEKELNENKIYNFIVNNIPNKSTKLQKNNEYGFFRSNEMNKIVLFTDKPQPTLLFKGLSNYFFDRIAFGFINKEETELIKRFKISKFPTLMIYKTIDRERFLDEPEITFYEGLIKPVKLVEFIEPHTLSEKVHQRQKRGIKENNVREMGQKMTLNKMTPANYEKIFEKYGSKNIIVYFDKKMRMKKSYKHYMIKN